MPKFFCSGRYQKPPTCTYESETRWLGRCPECGRLLAPLVRPSADDAAAGTTLADLVKAAKPIRRVSTGSPEFDRVLGGGFVRGSVALLTGGEGAGKSTLLMQTIKHICEKVRRPAVYASGEQKNESLAYIAQRVGAGSEYVIPVGGQDDMDKIDAVVKEKNPICLVIDSMQRVAFKDIDADFGSARQLSAIASYCNSIIIKSDIVIVLVGHRNSNDEAAGPRSIRHDVDVVLDLDEADPLDFLDDGEGEGEDRSEQKAEAAKGLRVLGCRKNRYGPEKVEALLEMMEDGSGLKTPSRQKSRRLHLV